MIPSFVVPIAICVLLGVVAAGWMRFTTTRLRRSRHEVGLYQFVGHFSKKGISTEVATAVYRYLSNLPWMHEFPVKPDDSLIGVYRIAGEELVDAYEALLAILGRSLPDHRRVDAFKVGTVEDLVQFVADLPRK